MAKRDPQTPADEPDKPKLPPQINLRLGDDAKRFLVNVSETEERTYVVIVTRALKLYAKENGYRWPSGEPDPETE